MAEPTAWRRCSACKNPIALGAVYWACNVSTCNQKRTALAFCTTSCWEVHLPGANHRESWAVERRAPTKPGPVATRKPRPAAAAKPAESRPTRRILVSPPTPKKTTEEVPREVLIVTSRLKDYVRARSGYNTSDRLLAPLSDILRQVVDQAIENARRDGRMTILDRDLPDS